MSSPYHGKQPGDPAKLREVLVKLAGMENPPRLFVAGGDGLAGSHRPSRSGSTRREPMRSWPSQRKVRSRTIPGATAPSAVAINRKDPDTAFKAIDLKLEN